MPVQRRLESICVLVLVLASVWPPGDAGAALGTHGDDSASMPPGQHPRFAAVIGANKVQAPTSHDAPCRRAACLTYVGDAFRLDTTGRYLTFEMEGENHRSEIRQLAEWRPGDPEPHRAIAEVRFAEPAPELDQFTFMQVHDSGMRPNRPMARLAWRRSRYGIEDHLWVAIVATPDRNANAEWYDLGPRGDSFERFEIEVRDGRVQVRRGADVVVSRDVSPWDAIDCYFKAGVYLQDSGRAEAHFRVLDFD